MGRKTGGPQIDIGPVLDLLGRTLKKKRIKFQDISVQLGKSKSWLTGVLCRSHHMYLDDFFAVCAAADIDPVEMMATDGFLKYIKNVPLVTIIDDAVSRQFQENIMGTTIAVSVPQKRANTARDRD